VRFQTPLLYLPTEFNIFSEDNIEPFNQEASHGSDPCWRLARQVRCRRQVVMSDWHVLAVPGIQRS
jgi:hypothetical protein